MQQRSSEKFYSCILKETITILQQAKAFLNFYCHQKENIPKIILEKCMTSKEAKSCCPRPRTGQFSRTWRVRGQGQGQGLQKLSSRPRTSSRPPSLLGPKFEKVLKIALGGERSPTPPRWRRLWSWGMIWKCLYPQLR